MKHIVCNNQLPDGVEFLRECHITPDKQLSFIADDDLVVANSVYEAVWDGKSESLTVLKGDPKTLTNRYAGWPEK